MATLRERIAEEMSRKISPINELPSDQFNVVVENDMDRARLLWLVNQIGEPKLRKSVAKYNARWPGSKPFVSTLLNHLVIHKSCARCRPR